MLQSTLVGRQESCNRTRTWGCIQQENTLPGVAMSHCGWFTRHCIGEAVEAVFRIRRWESCKKNPSVKKSTLGEQLASCCISQCEHESTGQVHESEVCPLYFGHHLIWNSDSCFCLKQIMAQSWRKWLNVSINMQPHQWWDQINFRWSCFLRRIISMRWFWFE